jgi:two-component system chemotaxis response regulator CheB
MHPPETAGVQPGHDVVVIGASAGGVEALREVARNLPEGLPAAVFVAVHLPPGSRSHLPEILARSGPLPAEHPKDRDRVRPGRIYVAPPDHHMLLEDGTVRLARGPHHNHHRPAIDPLFESAAKAHNSRVVGVILSGTLDDGTAGLARIKARGGVAIVQDPATAAHSGMPESALAHIDAEVVPLSKIGAAIAAAVTRPPTPASSALDSEKHAAMLRHVLLSENGPSATTREES